ncbi:MAG TPA: response regulator transcription factor [Candidatus Dormibacteraeota bacterium]|nr:response regulator transcription factor [Candidatus Dormibacteraeota bacterium]
MRVVIAEDSVLFREGLARLLEGAGYEVAGRAGDATELLRLVETHRPDIVVTDIRMPPTHTVEGLQAAAIIKEKHSDVAIMLLSQYVETTHAIKLLERGGEGVGYLLKDRVSDVRQFVDAVQRVAAGGSAIDSEVVSQLFARKRRKDLVDELTDRERETLRLMAEGRSNSAIASLLHMSEKTVEGHVRSIFSKLQLEPAADDHRRVLAVLTYLKAN